jgi:hypothetical protein
MVTIRPTVADDIPHLTSEPLPCRIKAWTAVDTDHGIIGIGGIAYLSWGIAGFLQIGERARRHKVLLHKTALRFLAMLRAEGVHEVVTYADPSIERAEPWLLRLGFRPEMRGNLKVYRWQHSQS